MTSAPPALLRQLGAADPCPIALPRQQSPGVDLRQLLGALVATLRRAESEIAMRQELDTGRSSL